MNPHTFCSYCGTRYEDLVWPRSCVSCQRMTWRNPIPVIVVLAPVTGGGIVTVRRGIQPKLGELALPGGYVDFGESWQTAAARELWEETSIDVRKEPSTFFSIFGACSASNDSLILIFCRTPVLLDLPAFVPNSECTERLIMKSAQELAFQTHTDMAAKFLAEGY